MSIETEIELGQVVAFPTKKESLEDSLVIQREGQKVMCLHSAVWVNEKDRTLRCRKCETLIEPFDFLMTLCDQESRYMESVKYLRREEKQRRQNIEKLIQIEKNAKSRIRRAGNKEPLPLWQNERVES
ncbi:hypothetical protein LB796_003459 [Salmonella enterica subsp. enterica serovar Worthington]|uniref:hypothetical protein n=1 Tax=Salmonella enterica TaxID=28901 RepID=UPI000E3D21A0|nr:hypothetical protein [Salmonella enterica]EAO1878838.1 hypothetical protein [Salmonella enterica subsp. enterica serovar Worthington]EBV8195923.1 hypothetical protein [Salmonella enterica subsp. enterica serovar Derby]ECS2870173.1 hypothetical protein [Salmonella enterica subsp. enterica serovar Farmsen]EEE0318751.1 hypothetical protein [Salmonella enterica subsp. enterica serovar Putten]HAU7624810.1 hypothetical protein [Salmonella enterica subsp. enterica]HCU0295091.1 hypothetical protei